MKLFRKIFKVKTSDFQCRYVCTKLSEEAVITKHVYVSQSTDIFANLALEDWLYSKTNFKKQEILMLWKSSPCVVIGRHQNPWLEANVDKLDGITVDGVKLARRNSGGGTVYHDEGNLNMSFFTTAEKYNRKNNLEIIKKALFREYKLNVDITKKYDLMVRNYKVSGTASKLARLNAYHHCTLLVNCNKDHIHQSLNSPEVNVETRATRSVRSKVLNLKDECPEMKISNVLRVIGLEFLQTPAKPDPNKKDVKIKTVDNGFHIVNPIETWFPGITDIQNKLTSWDWVYGMCPEFSVSRDVEVDNVKVASVKVQIEKGKIADVKFEGVNTLEKALYLEQRILEDFKEQKYSSEIINNLQCEASRLFSDITEKERRML